MRRAEIWWAALPPPSGERPVVLLSRDDAYSIRSLVTVAPVTTRVRGIPAEVSLGPPDGLARPSAANLDTVTTIAKSRLRHRIGMLPPEKIAALDRALKFALGIDG